MDITSILLPGEIQVACATNAQQIIYYTATEDCPVHTVSGTLLCTNYRLCFFPAEDSAARVAKLNCGNLSSSRDMPLGCISQVNMLSKGSRKTLDGRSTLPKKAVEIELIGKDLRRLIFSVKHSPKSEASSMVNALARHANPSSVFLLFAFDYTRAVTTTRGDATPSPTLDHPTPSFLNPRDWQKELYRLGVTNDQWRVTEANKRFVVCENLCPYFVCPTSVSDSMLEYAASLHQRNRIPVWCWSHPHTGVSLTRGAIPEVDDPEAPDPNYLHAIVMARHIDHQVESKKMQQFNLTKLCGTVKDVQTGFSRMQDLCTPSSSSDLAYLDKKWLLGLESSGWLAVVRGSLLVAKEVAHCLYVKKTCAMLLEDEGRDLSCVVSSLVQLMVDPHFRSVSGFEGLVQKEWVAMGHPFTTRHRLTLDSVAYGTEDQLREAPVFLLFLDCVWQLSRQFPSAFEFSETYLLHFYNLVHNCLYGNFIFDSSKRRVQASLHSKRSSFFGNPDESLEQSEDYEGPLISAWGRWRNSLSKEDNEQCLNPLYYIFASGDALYDYATANPLPGTENLNSVLESSKKQPDLGMGESCGVYRGPSPTESLKSKDNVRDFYQLGMLLPETSMCSIKIWSGFFFRHIPELKESCEQQLVVQGLESRLVRDVRKLKDELNELELRRGLFTSDLTSFIGEILQQREKEIKRERKISVDANIPFRPRLSAVVLPYNEIEDVMKTDGTENGDIPSPRKAKTFPSRLSSLAQFTDALYSSEIEEGSSPRLRLMERSKSIPGCPGTPSGRSPVTKTRLRVTRTDSADPVQLFRWHSSSSTSDRHSPLVATRILNRKDSGVLEESADELTEL